jgi:hypothetical protein
MSAVFVATASGSDNRHAASCVSRAITIRFCELLPISRSADAYAPDSASTNRARKPEYSGHSAAGKRLTITGSPKNVPSMTVLGISLKALFTTNTS